MSSPAGKGDVKPIPVRWTRRVLTLAAPIVLANLTQPLLSAVDTGIAGHLPGEAALGGVALGGLFFNFVFWGFGFLRMGTTGLVAQAYGAGDAAGLRLILLRALVLATGIGIGLVLLQAPLIDRVIGLLGGSAAVQGFARAYAGARIWSGPAALANYVVLGYLLGRQLPRLALVLQLAINLANMVAAVACVYGLGLGVAGLGAATAAADWIGLAVGIALLFRVSSGSLPRVLWHDLLDRRAMLALIAVNRDIFLRTLCLIFSFAWFAHGGAALGDTVLAANALLLNFQLFMAYGLDGFAHAAEALVGAAMGARDRAAFRMATMVCMAWSAIGALGFSLVFWLAGPAIIEALSDQAGIRAAAMTYLPWAAVSPLLSVWCFLLDGVFIGATRTKEMRDGMVIALLLFLGASLLLEPLFGNHGLWMSLLFFLIVRGAILACWLGRIDRALAAS